MAKIADSEGSRSPADEAAEYEDAQGRPASEDADKPQQEAEAAPTVGSLTVLFERLAREVSELGASEAKLEAARNMPEVRRSARDIAITLIVVIAALTAFAFVNVAALDGLSKAVANWLAALVLAAGWIVLAGGLALGLLGRVRHWLSWILFTSPPAEAISELERDRNAAAEAALRTLKELGPALAAQVALAAVPDAGDFASGVVGLGDETLEGVDEIVEEFTEQLPGGGAVNQVWDVVLMPGRFGIKVATTVFQRGRPADSGRPHS